VSIELADAPFGMVRGLGENCAVTKNSELDAERVIVAGLPLLFVTVTVVFEVPPGDTVINVGFREIENPAACAGVMLTAANAEQISIAASRIVDGFITIPTN